MRSQIFRLTSQQIYGANTSCVCLCQTITKSLREKIEISYSQKTVKSAAKVI